jgi:hypothetical protein
LRRPARRGLGQTTESLPFIFPSSNLFSKFLYIKIRICSSTETNNKTKIQNEIDYYYLSSETKLR